jgi:hypothetical protein
MAGLYVEVYSAIHLNFKIFSLTVVNMASQVQEAKYALSFYGYRSDVRGQRGFRTVLGREPYLLTYLRSWALPEKLPIVQPLRNFPAF